VRRGILRPLDDDVVAELAELAMEQLEKRGYLHYELSNWARAGCSRSIHNTIYWRNGFYLGVGAGAHGYLAGIRTVNERLPARYIARVEAGDLPTADMESIDPRTELVETMMLGLRLVADGISAAGVRARHGVELSEAYGPELDELVQYGLIEWDGERLRLSRRGILLANEVAVRFLEPRGTLK
jgi:oxygen-independent coproporphyrinogen-3 oxidase